MRIIALLAFYYFQVGVTLLAFIYIIFVMARDKSLNDTTIEISHENEEVK